MLTACEMGPLACKTRSPGLLPPGPGRVLGIVLLLGVAIGVGGEVLLGHLVVVVFGCV